MKAPPAVSRFLSDYGMLVVLLVLCAFLSLITIKDQEPVGAAAAEDVLRQLGTPGRLLIAAGAGAADQEFAKQLKSRAEAERWTVVQVVLGEPKDARKALGAAGALDAVGCTAASAVWEVFANQRVVSPRRVRGSTFLTRDNLTNVAGQIAVIAILAVGMTLVILTGGIDLAVGSLIALSAVVAARLIRDLGGGEAAGTGAVLLSWAAAIGVCAAAGLFSGAMVTYFTVPPFIATLSMMLIASGAAFMVAEGETISQVPPEYERLGRISVLLMVALYAAAHVMMTRTALGRYLYAVGGNTEAAWLSGVPVRRVLLFAYTACGALAGLGGVVTSSQLGAGAPTYGVEAELATIAAVVIGGTSLSGGEGRILGTLIGAFIIAVIKNGMNLTGIESHPQKVVLGVVILGAVLLDILKRRGLGVLKRFR